MKVSGVRKEQEVKGESLKERKTSAMKCTLDSRKKVCINPAKYSASDTPPPFTKQTMKKFSILQCWFLFYSVE